MKTINILFIISAMIFLLIFSSCFPTYKAAKVEIDSLRTGTYKDIQAKVFTSDNDILLFRKGFTVKNNCLEGIGTITNIYQFQNTEQKIIIPLDSITAMTTYEESTSVGRYFGSFLFAITAPPLTFLGVYCIACPKCCFGSCPTIYTYDGEKYNLEAELFSECISKQLENNDIDLLRQKFINDTLKLKITNEALETHYINKFQIVVAEHTAGTELYPAIDNELLLIKEHEPLITATNKEGTNVANLLKYDDNKYYRSGVNKVSELKKGPEFDWIDMKVPASKNSSTKMVLKYRNTLLSTTLLYNVVIGSQGIDGMKWTKRMNEDPAYAAYFKMIYDEFSGIKIKIFEDGIWKELGKFKDAGPLNWKYITAKLPKSQSGNLQIRLEFIPDNFMIDYVAFDTTSSSGDFINTKVIYPFEVFDGLGNKADSLIQYVKFDDLNYLITEPGDCYYLDYKYPVKNNDETTALIYSKGYYNEWIRGSWINNKNDGYKFNLFDINGTLSHLADSWLENNKLLEKEFFHSRFSLKEGR